MTTSLQPSTLTQLMTGIANLSREQLPNLQVLTERLKAIFKASGVFSQGAIVRLDEQRSVLGSWGMSKRSVNRLLPDPALNGGSLHVPRGWQAFEIGTRERPFSLVLKRGNDPDQVLPLLLAQLTTVWQSVLLHEDFVRREQAITTLTRSLEGLAQQPNIEEFLQRIVSEATELINASGGGLYLRVGDSNEFTLRYVAKFPKKYVGLPLQKTQGGLSKLIETNTPLLVNNYQDYGHKVVWPDGIIITSLIAVPVRSDDRVIGVLAHLSIDPEVTFNHSDLALLESFAAQAAIALRTGRLFNAQRQQARELYVLYENSRTIGSSLNLQHILERLNENVLLALDIEQSAVLLWNNEQQTFDLMAYAADEQTLTHVTPPTLGTQYTANPDSILAKVSHSQQPQTLANIRANVRGKHNLDIFGDSKIRSLLAVPLTVMDQSLGVLLCVTTQDDRAFLPSEITLAQTLASQAANAIGNSRLLADEQRRSHELTILRNLNNSFNSGLNISAALEAISSSIHALLSNVEIEICLYNPQTQLLHSEYVTSSLHDYLVTRNSGVYQIDQGLSGWLARHRMPLRIGDITKERTFKSLSAYSDAPFHSYLGVPLLVGEELIGTIEISSEQINQFDSEDERLLTIIAGQSAQAIRNLRRYEATDEVLRERVRELLSLQRISRDLTSTLHLDQLLPMMLQEVNQTTASDHSLVLLYDEDGHSKVTAQTGFAADINLNQAIRTLQKYEYLPTNGDQTEARILDDLSILESAVQFGDVRSLMYAPILYENQTAGLIIATAAQPAAFDHLSLDFIRAIADQAALAIGNAHHFEEQVKQRELLQQRASLLNEVLEIGNALRADMELASLLEQIAFSITESAGFREVVFRLIDSEEPTTLHTVAGAGISLVELQTLREQPIALETILSLLDPQYRIGRAYYVPKDADSASDEWQDGDQLIVPLYNTERELIGVFSVDDPFTNQRPNRRTIETLEIFANQAAVAIENATLFNQRSRQIAELGIINRISRAATASLDFYALSQQVYEVLRDLMPMTAFFIALLNEDSTHIIRSWAVDRDEVMPNVLAGPVMPASFMGWVINNKKLLFFSNVLNQIAEYPTVQLHSVNEEDTEHSPRSWIGVPLISGDGQVRGVLSIQHLEVGKYSQRDADFLGTIANQLVVGVENARLFSDVQQRLQEFALINRVGNLTISRLDTLEILRGLVVSLQQLVEIDIFYCFIFESTTQQIVQRFAVDRGVETISYDQSPLPANGPSEWVINHQEPLIFGDITAETVGRFSLYNLGDPDEERPRSWIGVPLKTSDSTALGLLSIQHYQANVYTQRDIDILQTIASQVALAIQNARLFSDRERQIRELDAISSVGQLVSASMDLHDMLQRTSEALVEVTHAPIFYAMVYDPVQEKIIDGYAVQEGVVATTMPIGKLRPGSFGEWVVKHRAPILLANLLDADEIKRYGLQPVNNLITGNENAPHSFVGVPILSRNDEAIGMISLQNYHIKAFDQQTIQFLTNVATHVSLGLQKVQLFNERDRQIKELDVIQRVGQVMSSSLDASTIMRGVYNVLKDFFPIDSFVFSVFKPNTLYRIASLGIDDDQELELPINIDIPDNSLTAWILHHNRPLLFRHFDTDIEQYPEISSVIHGSGHEPQSWVGVPLRSKNEVPFGVLALQNYQPEVFGERDLALLTNIAYQIALGMENVRLYEETQQSMAQLSEEAERLALINRVSNLTATQLDTQAIFDLAVEEMVSATDASQSRLVIFDRKRDIGVTHALYPADGDPNLTIPLRNNETITWMDQHHSPLIINNPLEDPLLAVLHDTIRELKINAILLVPLIFKNEVIGSIGVDHIDNDQTFSDYDANTCQIIANQIAQALENARLFSQTQHQAQTLERKVGELSVLLQAGQALSSLHESEQVLDVLVRLVAQQLKVDTVMLSTLTSDDYLQPVASLSLPETFTQAMRIRRGEGLIGAVAEQEKPLIIANVARDYPTSHYPSFNQKYGLTSFLGVPVRYRDKLMGVLSVMSRNEANFSDDDIPLLSALSDQAAIALENTRLFGERERQITVLQALNDVTQAISSTLDTQSLIRQLHAQLSNVVDTSFSFICLYDQARNLLTFPVVFKAGKSVEQEPLPLADGALSQVVKTHRTVLLNQLEEDDLISRVTFDAEKPIASWLGVPIALGDQILGVINVQSHEPNAFPPDVVQFLQAVASQTAIALENAHLFSEREQQVAEAAILSTISQSMTATLTPEELAVSILRGIEPVLDISNAYIVLYDAPSNMVSTTTGFSRNRSFSLATHLLTNDFLKKMLFEQQPVIFNHKEDLSSARLQTNAEIEHLDLQPIEVESVIAAAITMGSQTTGMLINQPLGAIVVQSEQPNAFTPQQLHFLESVSNQASGAVQKAVLFSERERRIRELDTLNRISQGITSTIDLTEMMQRLHQGMNEIVDMSTSYIAMYDSLLHRVDYFEEHDRGTRVRLASNFLRGGIPSWVINNRQSLLLNTSREANEYRDDYVIQDLPTTAFRIQDAEEEEQSFLVVPIVVGNDVLGIINVQSYDQYAFSEYDLNFVMTVAGQAGAAIANARMFAQRERSIQQLRQLNTIGQALASTVRVEDLYRVIYEQTSALVDTQNFYLALYDERANEISFPIWYEHGERQVFDATIESSGLTEYVIKTRQPLLLQGSNLKEDMQERGINLIGELPSSWLGIPLIATDKVVGVMAVQDYINTNAFTEDAVQLLSTIASQAAQALENARLYTDSRESVRELSVLSDTSVSLAATLDISELLTIATSSAIEMSRADFGGIILVNDDLVIEDSLILDRDLVDYALPQLHAINVQDMYRLRTVRVGVPLTIHDAVEEASLNPLTETLPIHGIAFLPMMNEQQLQGVVFVARNEPYTFDERTVASLSILSSQIAQSINKAQMFSQVRRFNIELEEEVDKRTGELKQEKERVEVLYNIATELGTTLDRDELLLRTLDLAAKSLNADRGAVFLLDRETKELICHAVLNEELGLKPIERRVKFDRPGLINWVIEHNEGIVIDDVRDDPRWSNAETGRGDNVRSVIAVPLLSSDAPQGVLMLNSGEINFFSPDHLRFLSTIAGEVSSALHNADLYTLVFESADRLSEAMWRQREEASKTSAILQSVSEGVVVLDHESGEIILYNPAAEEVLRVPRQDVMNHGLLVFAVPRNEEELHEEGRALMLYTGLNEGIHHVRSSDTIYRTLLELPGQVIAANFAPVNAEDGSRFGVVMVLRDITREIEADRAKRDFIATVSHELRTPLTPIRGFVDLLMLGAVGELNDPQREMLNTVKTNTMRMVSLVEDLLEIGRLEAGKITLNTTPSNINNLIRDTVAMWNLELEKKNMTLTFELDETLPLVEYDTKRVGQVLTNLVSNAIKYTYAGGAVTMRTFRNADDLIQVDVQDSGVGLTPDQQKSLFRRFYRADSPLRDEVGGTGLGLSIAKSFIELHHGDMWVQSIYGEGSTFSFTLPEQQPHPDLGDSDELEQAQ